MNYELLELKNGLKTLFIHSPGATMGSTQIWFRAGSALEEQKDHGIAHFLEHMFFKGTKKRPGAQVAHDVESFGGEINAFTSFDYTCYYINHPSTSLQSSVEILLDMVSNPLFKQEDLIPERNVVHEEYRRSIDSPNQYAFMTLQESCFEGGYRHPILGSEQHIKSFSREQLLSFRKNYYNRQNALFVVSGDLKEKDQIIKLIEKHQLPSGQESRFPQFRLKKQPSIHAHDKAVKLVQLNFAIEGVPLHDTQAAAEDLALNCLGHGETSPLHKKLVLQNSLASQAGSSTLFMNNGSAHFIKFVFPEQNLKKLLDRLVETFKTLLKKGFTEDEVQRIKNQYLASKVYEMESLEAYAFSLGNSYAQTGDLHSEENFLKSIKTTSTDQVNRALRSILSRPLHLNIQVPKGTSLKNAESELKRFSQQMQGLSREFQSLPENQIKAVKSKYDPQVKLVDILPGVQLLHRHNPINPTFVLHAYLNGGLAYETAKNNGLHHLITGLLVKGYKGRPYDRLKHELENTSTSFNGFSGKNAYGLTMHGLSEHFPKLFEHFLGSLLSPQFPAKFLTHEKNITLRNLDAQKEDPVRLCFQLVAQNFFKGHPYQQNILGREEVIKSLKREDLLQAHLRNVQSRPILFTYCGDLPIEEVKKQLEQGLGSLKSRRPKTRTSKRPRPLTEKIHRLKIDREQTHLFYGIQIGPIDSDDNATLKMLTTYLSGQSSELFVEVRDRQGLCYTAQPVHFNALEAGYWGIYMGTGNEKVQPALKAIQDIIGKIRAKGLSLQEFERIKKMIEGQSLINVQTNDDYANIYSVPVFQNLGLDYYYNNNNAIRELTHKTFQRELKEVLSRPWGTVIVGAP